MAEVIHSIVYQITNIIQFLGYWGLSVGMFLESACIPLPSELVLPLGGMMVSNGQLTMLGANIAVNIGSMAGSFAAYMLGRAGGRPYILKYGNKFFISQKHFHSAENAFNKYGAATVFFGRLLPVIRTFISLPAGIAKMNAVKFGVYSLMGMIPWNFTLIYLGFKFNQQYETIVRPLFKRFDHIVIAAVCLLVLLWVIKMVIAYKRRKSQA